MFESRPVGSGFWSQMSSDLPEGSLSAQYRHISVSAVQYIVGLLDYEKILIMIILVNIEITL